MEVAEVRADDVPVDLLADQAQGGDVDQRALKVGAQLRIGREGGGDGRVLDSLRAHEDNLTIHSTQWSYLIALREQSEGSPIGARVPSAGRRAPTGADEPEAP